MTSIHAEFLQVFIRSQRSTHIRVIFYIGNTIGFPKDILVERASEAYGERHFLTNYHDEYTYRLNVAQLDSLAMSAEHGDDTQNDVSKEKGSGAPSASEVSDVSHSNARKKVAKKNTGSDSEGSEDPSVQKRSSAKGEGLDPAEIADGHEGAEQHDLKLGFVLLQDLRQNPDTLDIYDYQQDKTKKAVGWHLRLPLDQMQRYLQIRYSSIITIKSLCSKKRC